MKEVINREHQQIQNSKIKLVQKHSKLEERELKLNIKEAQLKDFEQKLKSDQKENDSKLKSKEIELKAKEKKLAAKEDKCEREFHDRELRLGLEERKLKYLNEETKKESKENKLNMESKDAELKELREKLLNKNTELKNAQIEKEFLLQENRNLKKKLLANADGLEEIVQTEVVSEKHTVPETNQDSVKNKESAKDSSNLDLENQKHSGGLKNCFAPQGKNDITTTPITNTLGMGIVSGTAEHEPDSQYEDELVFPKVERIKQKEDYTDKKKVLHEEGKKLTDEMADLQYDITMEMQEAVHQCHLIRETIDRARKCWEIAVAKKKKTKDLSLEIAVDDLFKFRGLGDILLERNTRIFSSLQDLDKRLKSEINIEALMEEIMNDPLKLDTAQDISDIEEIKHSRCVFENMEFLLDGVRMNLLDVVCEVDIRNRQSLLYEKIVSKKYSSEEDLEDLTAKIRSLESQSG